MLELPSRAAVRDYLVGKGVGRSVAAAEAETVEVPLSVTKRGALVFARKRHRRRRTRPAVERRA